MSWQVLTVVLFLTGLQGSYGQSNCQSQPAIPEEMQIDAELQAAEEELTPRLRNGWKSEQSGKKNDEIAALETSSLTASSTTSSTVVRKEYRQMTQAELTAFHSALQALKDSGMYDAFVDDHAFNVAQSAHFGVGFLPWHREFLHLFELALREVSNDPSIFVPYWDSPLDQTLSSPEESVLWTDQFWGSNSGFVRNGELCPDWSVSSRCSSIGGTVRRSYSGNPNLLYSRDRIANLYAAQTYTELMVPTTSQFEQEHGVVHCNVGGCTGGGCTGHMGCVSCSPSDPIFWMHHSFVDYLWDEWASLEGRINTYPQPGVEGATVSNMGGLEHLADAPMNPFNKNNIDGFQQDFYTGYQERPSKIVCASDADCLSETGLLFCHECLCVSKIREGGPCSNFGDHACACFPKRNGRPSTPSCWRGACRCR